MKAFRFVSIIVVLVLLASSTVPVAAKPPTRYTILTSGTGEYDCGTFKIANEWSQESVYTEFFDKQGDLIRLWGMLRITETYSHGGKVAMGKNNLVIAVDFTDGEPNRIRNMGIAYHVVLPGVGTIFIDAGYAEMAAPEWELILHGNHQYYSGDFDKLCAALE